MPASVRTRPQSRDQHQRQRCQQQGPPCPAGQGKSPPHQRRKRCSQRAGEQRAHMKRSGIYASHRAHAMPKIARNDHQTRNVADSQTGTNEQSPCEHPEQPRATAQTTPRHRLPDRSPWHARTQKPPIRSLSPAKTAKTRAQIIEAALAEFLRQGHAAATMCHIVQRAGLPKGTLYICFENKEALFLGLIEQVVKGPLSEVEKQPIREKELVVDHFRRTLLPAMRTMEMTWTRFGGPSDSGGRGQVSLPDRSLSKGSPCPLPGAHPSPCAKGLPARRSR